MGDLLTGFGIDQLRLNRRATFDRCDHGHVAPGRARLWQDYFEAEPGDYLLNPMGFVHGGFAATLPDSAMGVAVHPALEPGMGFTAAELKISYTRAILPTSGRFRAEGGLIHRDQRIATSGLALSPRLILC